MKEIPTVKMNIDELLPADYNPRKISNAAFKGLKESIKKFGELGGIVYNKRTGRLVGGHQRVRALKSLGYKEVDVRVVDFDETDEKLANITLNNNSIMGQFDDTLLKPLLIDIKTNIENGDIMQDLLIDSILDVKASNPKPPVTTYTEKKYTPVYEPSDRCPKIEELYSTEKRDALIKEIQAADIDDTIKIFLIAAAERHVKFNFARIADFYAHASKSVQELIEHSALVIIDVDNAIANGFVELENNIRKFHRIDDDSQSIQSDDDEDNVLWIVEKIYIHGRI